MRFIVDAGGDEESSVMVVGSGRSGTTWIGEVLASLARARLIFEPFLLDEECEIAALKSRRLRAHALRHDLQFYLPSDAECAPSYDRPLGEILCGRVRNRWCDKLSPSGFYRRRVIKEIRGNLSLGYLARRWPRLKIIWVVRNPVSVVRSQLKMSKKFNFKFDFDIDNIVFRERLIADWLTKYAPVKYPSGNKIQRLAQRWCIETMVPLWQEVHKLDNVRLVRYENLVSGASAWDPILRFVNWPLSRELAQAPVLTRPSRTTKIAPDLDADDLTQDDEASIEAIVEGYSAGAWLGSRPSRPQLAPCLI